VRDVTYYRTPSGVEVDFIWNGPQYSVGIEVKSTRRWRSAYSAPLRELHAGKVIRRAVAVYEGEHAQKDGPVEVLPVREFLQRLPDLIR
jgi:predicted AAA+ superfamily ATPase